MKFRILRINNKLTPYMKRDEPRFELTKKGNYKLVQEASVAIMSQLGFTTDVPDPSIRVGDIYSFDGVKYMIETHNVSRGYIVFRSVKTHELLTDVDISFDFELGEVWEGVMEARYYPEGSGYGLERDTAPRC